MGNVRTKDGVTFGKIAPAGFRILAAITDTAADLPYDLTITAGDNGLHSGPDDPHYSGEAYDVRSNDLTPEQKENILKKIMSQLGTIRFYGFLEAAGTPNEHFHIQRARGTTYP